MPLFRSLRRLHHETEQAVSTWYPVSEAVAVSSYLSTETRLTRYHLARCQARAWAKAGVLLAMQRLASDAMQPEDASQPELAYDWLGDDWAVR